MGLNHWVYFHSILPESFLVMNIFSQKLEARAVGVASTLKLPLALSHCPGEPHCSVRLPPKPCRLPAQSWQDWTCGIKSDTPQSLCLHEPSQGRGDGHEDPGCGQETGGYHGEESRERHEQTASACSQAASNGDQN